MPELEDLQIAKYSEDYNLWSIFDISVGLDDGFKLPSCKGVVE